MNWCVVQNYTYWTINQYVISIGTLKEQSVKLFAKKTKYTNHEKTQTVSSVSVRWGNRHIVGPIFLILVRVKLNMWK